MDVGLTDLELGELSKVMRIKPLIYIGTKDKLDLVMNNYKNKFFIINLDNSLENGGGGGTHWTCFSTFDKYPIYFDSYSMVPPLEVEKYIKERYKKFYYWNKQIQSVRATYCGYIVLMFLHILYKDYILKNKSLFEFVNYFESLFNTDDQSKNYYVINNYFSKFI